jgi:hypothetical protein
MAAATCQDGLLTTLMVERRLRFGDQFWEEIQSRVAARTHERRIRSEMALEDEIAPDEDKDEA